MPVRLSMRQALSPARDMRAARRFRGLLPAQSSAANTHHAPAPPPLRSASTWVEVNSGASLVDELVSARPADGRSAHAARPRAPKAVLVALDASGADPLRAVSWAVDNVATTGDTVHLLSVVPLGARSLFAARRPSRSLRRRQNERRARAPPAVAAVTRRCLCASVLTN